MEPQEYHEPSGEYKKQILDLHSMLEIGKTLNAASLSLKNVLDIVILTCYGHFHSQDAVILLSTEDGDKIYFTGEAEEKKISVELTNHLELFLGEKERAIFIEEMKKNSGIVKEYRLFCELGFELLIPLRFKDRINGLLCLTQKEEAFGDEYTEDEKRYMVIIAGFASVAIENARLYEMATLDRKTKLYNHGFFANRLTQEIERAERYKTDLTLMILDLDHFKNVNDKYGHMVGDEVLIAVSKSIKNQVRGFDVPARFGGEEFTVILPETNTKSAEIVAQRLRTAIKALVFTTPKGKFSVAVSIGIAGFVHESNMTDNVLIAHSDLALYHAKEHGRDRIVFYSDIPDPTT
jgi:diguanylate cyclase (GGDEF)-like protein